MKVFLVTSYMKSKGGVSKYVDRLAKYLSSQNDHVTIVSLYADNQLFHYEKGVTIKNLSNEKILPQSIHFWLNLKKIQKKFSKLVHEDKPDVILFNDFPATLWAQDFPSIPTLCYTHDIHMLYTNTYIKNLSTITRYLWRIIRIFARIYDKKQWNYFDEIICNSHFLSKYILKTYKVQSHVIYPGIDNQIFCPSTNCSKKRAILTFADLEIRRADFLLLVASKLIQKRNDFQIWIVGNRGKNDIKLKKLVKKYHIENNVKFFGMINDDVELSKIYSESLVLTHLVEESAFGIIAGEAMSCQTPVIAWKPSGLEELIEDGINGFNIEANNLDVLKNHIEKFLDDPKLSEEMGKNARIRSKSLIQQNQKFGEIRDLFQYWIQKKKI